MDRLAYRQIVQKPGLYRNTTSGSTGVSVTVEKYKAQKDNVLRHTKLFDSWHNWEPKAKTLRLYPVHTIPVWKGNTLHSNHYVPGDYEQLIAFPQLFPKDLTQFKRIISYGGAWTGVGIDIYSSEEFGYIAVQCPHNKEVLHIMDNIFIKFTPDGMLISDYSHPYLKLYEIGDYAEPAVCNCGIDLPAMTHVKGRIRNMLKLPDGSSHWPITGLYGINEIERFQVFQESLTKLRVHITGTFPLKAYTAMRKALGYDFEIEVVQGNFKPGKFEEFICEI